MAQRRKAQGKNLPKVLVEPIRAYKFPPEDRDRLIAEAVAERWEAIRARYDVKTTPKWEEIAHWLACELFPGCRILEAARGGAPKKVLKHRRLARLYDSFLERHPRLKGQRAAEKFIKLHSRECDELSIATWRSLLNAVRIGRNEHQSRVSGWRTAAAGYGIFVPARRGLKLPRIVRDRPGRRSLLGPYRD